MCVCVCVCVKTKTCAASEAAERGEHACGLLIAALAVAIGVVLVRLLVHREIVALLVDAAALDDAAIGRRVNLALSFDRQLLIGAGFAAHKVAGQPVVCVCCEC